MAGAKFWPVVIVGLLLMLVPVKIPVFEPRGIRNNNPGNIRADENFTWNGQVGVDDKGFVIFDKPENGIRATGRNLDSYAIRGVDTIEEIIATWAPRNENNTESYIQAVESGTGWNRNSILSRAHYPELVKAIIKHENGKQPYSDELIQYGLGLA
jgi:hypothetical protein